MKYLVTGGAGRLGSRLVQELSHRGLIVKAFDLPNANWDSIKNLYNVELIKGNLLDLESLSRCSDDVDVIFHLAAFLPPNSEVNKDLTFKVNVDGTRNIVNIANANALVVFASSISIYGITANDSPPIDETRPQQSHNCYSASKILAEQVVRTSGKSHVILRIAPIAVADLLELPDVIPYRADQRVELIYVDDVAHALFKSSLSPKAINKSLNVAGGSSWQMTGIEYIKEFYKAIGMEVEPVFSEEYTAVDWYDTSQSEFFGYQRTSFNNFSHKHHSDKSKFLGHQPQLRH